ncbi:hypothetical protein K491DRAFT_721074 [Lophiostoma macrostomum CBS 122681]|uniref:F-box domain-containing protein n=1 Tax=Lophiostoma macrostomum CBS 122681 TaxID=1314788 RepID=A0A6A6SU51_9PLEO|nr:hypothetical protein K491DRAFT_721074 [Lophiostoma macrostomum CBS 122681]
MTSTPFRFLDLPQELRLMVFEFLPITAVHHTIKHRLVKDHGEVKIITHTVAIQILCVNRQIYNEAKSTMYGKLNTFRFSVPRIIMTSNAHAVASGKRGLLPTLFDWLLRLHDNPRVKFEQWKATPTFAASALMLNETKYPGVALFIKQSGFKLMNIFNAMKEHQHFCPLYLNYVNVAFDVTASEEHYIDPLTGVQNHFFGSYWHVFDNVYKELRKTYRSLSWNVFPKDSGVNFVIQFCMTRGMFAQMGEVELVGIDSDVEGLLWEQGWEEGQFLM